MMKESKFQFNTPYLEELEFSINNDFTNKSVDVEMENSFAVYCSKIDNCENSALVKLDLTINDDVTDKPFGLHIIVAAEFIWEDLDQEYANNLLKTAAPEFLLGFARPIIANITNMSQFPCYNVPFLNFNE